MKLTRREEEVLVGIAKGLSTKQIAKKLLLSQHTIMTYRKQLLHKMKVINAPALVYKATKIGILS